MCQYLVLSLGFYESLHELSAYSTYNTSLIVWSKNTDKIETILVANRINNPKTKYPISSTIFACNGYSLDEQFIWFGLIRKFILWLHTMLISWNCSKKKITTWVANWNYWKKTVSFDRRNLLDTKSHAQLSVCIRKEERRRFY